MKTYPKNSAELKVFALRLASEKSTINANNIDKHIELSDKIYNYLGGDNYTENNKTIIDEALPILSIIIDMLAQQLCSNKADSNEVPIAPKKRAQPPKTSTNQNE